jgi:hypothetical protein
LAPAIDRLDEAIERAVASQYRLPDCLGAAGRLG